MAKQIKDNAVLKKVLQEKKEVATCVARLNLDNSQQNLSIVIMKNCKVNYVRVEYSYIIFTSRKCIVLSELEFNQHFKISENEKKIYNYCF